MTNCIHDHSRWGAGDQIGAAGHLLNSSTTLSALSSIKLGEIIDLSHTIEMGAPFMAPNQTPYIISSSATARNSMKIREKMGAKNKVGANLERIEMTTHVGTHIDSLGHFSIGEHLYGGYNIEDSVGDWGLVNLGIENVPPIITRGVCLDVSRLDGTDNLEAGRGITADDLKKTYDKLKLAPQKGDVVCLNTGWGKYFMNDNRKYLSGEPGLDLGAAKWLTEQNAVAIGADNMAVEVLPGSDHPDIMMPVHQHCLAEAGVHLIENLNLVEITRRSISVFCIIILPVKLKGATGCPVRPTALI
ncbi:MAG: cyclase [Rhodospirillaceae bacterium]|nr:cyclase [Rhodospirillaceae bacterium]|tara:strand:+ start:143 stop:1048 length:906 start_codon:yes stop_codon:yes gene_type:complete